MTDWERAARETLDLVEHDADGDKLTLKQRFFVWAFWLGFAAGAVIGRIVVVIRGVLRFLLTGYGS